MFGYPEENVSTPPQKFLIRLFFIYYFKEVIATWDTLSTGEWIFSSRENIFSIFSFWENEA